MSTLTDEHLREIGRICVNFEHLSMSIAFWIDFGLDAGIGTSQIFTSCIPYKRLVNCLAALVSKRLGGRDDPRVQEFRVLCGNLDKADDQRNEIMHSSWGYNATHPNPSRLKVGYKSRDVHFRCEQMSAADLKRIADDIADIEGRMMKFFTRDDVVRWVRASVEPQPA